MDNQNNGSGRRDFSQRPDRQMFQGDWKCSECGEAITELPFQPEGDRPLYCRNCHRARMQSRDGGRRY